MSAEIFPTSYRARCLSQLAWWGVGNLGIAGCIDAEMDGESESERESNRTWGGRVVIFEQKVVGFPMKKQGDREEGGNEKEQSRQTWTAYSYVKRCRSREECKNIHREGQGKRLNRLSVGMCLESAVFTSLHIIIFWACWFIWLCLYSFICLF